MDAGTRTRRSPHSTWDADQLRDAASALAAYVELERIAKAADAALR